MTAESPVASAVRCYEPAEAAAWDDFVADSVNGTILHTRSFLSYHGDRFIDRSLLVTNRRGRVVGVLPAAEDPADPSVVTSHPGLTYGGLVHAGKLHGESMVSAFGKITALYRSLGFTRLRYKAVPPIYQSAPGADDVYALFRLGASRPRCDLAAVINLSHRGRVWPGRLRWRKRAENSGIVIKEGWDDIAAYWQMLEANLASRHGATPTHTLAEIEYLHERFPTQFILITAKVDDVLAAGNLFSIEGPVMQARYTATTEVGRAVSATDLVIEQGIALARERGCHFYSMGTSTLDEGRELNEPQYDFKVSFGAGGVVHETYELDLDRVPAAEHTAVYPSDVR
jgi:hypothetical protein